MKGTSLLGALILLFVFCRVVLYSAFAFAENEWAPPIGVPEPPFGVHETHRDYEGRTYDFGSGPVAYPLGPDGPYTHYVDNRNPSATDVDNTFGTYERPRASYPTVTNLQPGSVIEIHGGPHGALQFHSSGTAEMPIFIRGVEGDRPIVRPPYYV